MLLRLIRLVLLGSCAAQVVHAQVPSDTAAIARALASHISAAAIDGITRGGYPAVAIDSLETPWSVTAIRALRAALPSSAAPRSESEKYYSLQLRFDALKLNGARATSVMTWALCRQGRAGQHMNMWRQEVEYSLVRADSGWIVANRTVVMIADGHCDHYVGKLSRLL